MVNVSRNQKIAESAVMIALAAALRELSALVPWPFLQGGSVTLFGMVPIIIIAYRHGTKHGITTALAFSVIEMLFGLKNFSYVTGIAQYVVLALSDYLIAFGVLGLGGVFKGKFKNKQRPELAAGGVLCCLLRFICHFVSGIVIWGGYCPEDQAVWTYSILYNGAYMLPETIITVIGLIAVASIFNLDKKRIS